MRRRWRGPWRLMTTWYYLVDGVEPEGAVIPCGPQTEKVTVRRWSRMFHNDDGLTWVIDGPIVAELARERPWP